MKKSLLILVGVFLTLPVTIGSLTWQMDSNQFQWPGVLVTSSGPDRTIDLSLTYKTEATGGIVNISYALPPGVGGATLRIFGVSGALIKDFRLQPGSAAVQWNIGTDRVAPGVYVASLWCGTLENKQHIAIIK